MMAAEGGGCREDPARSPSQAIWPWLGWPRSQRVDTVRLRLSEGSCTESECIYPGVASLRHNLLTNDYTNSIVTTKCECTTNQLIMPGEGGGPGRQHDYPFDMNLRSESLTATLHTW